jgi:hypothetical protein
LRILQDKLGFAKFHLYWMLHALLINQKVEKVSYSKFLLTALIGQKTICFQWIVTGNEPRFFFYYPRDSTWAAPPDEHPQRIERRIDTEKCWVSIL